MALGPSSCASVRRRLVARLEDVERAYGGPRAHHRSLTHSQRHSWAGRWAQAARGYVVSPRATAGWQRSAQS
jgi:hypothetical protein